MKLAKKTGNTITVKDYVTLPDLGVYAIGENIDCNFLNKNGYYEVLPDPEYDNILQQLGSYEIVENKAVRQVIDKAFGTIEEEKAKKIKQLNNIYQKRITDAIYPWNERAAFGDVVPLEINKLRTDLRDECNAKETQILSLAELREVLLYEY